MRVSKWAISSVLARKLREADTVPTADEFQELVDDLHRKAKGGFSSEVLQEAYHIEQRRLYAFEEVRAMLDRLLEDYRADSQMIFQLGTIAQVLGRAQAGLSDLEEGPPGEVG